MGTLLTYLMSVSSELEAVCLLLCVLDPPDVELKLLVLVDDGVVPGVTFEDLVHQVEPVLAGREAQAVVRNVVEAEVNPLVLGADPGILHGF